MHLIAGLYPKGPPSPTISRPRLEVFSHRWYGPERNSKVVAKILFPAQLFTLKGHAVAGDSPCACKPHVLNESLAGTYVDSGEAESCGKNGELAASRLGRGSTSGSPADGGGDCAEHPNPSGLYRLRRSSAAAARAHGNGIRRGNVREKLFGKGLARLLD
jgi:hypothetical protein